MFPLTSFIFFLEQKRKMFSKKTSYKQFFHLTALSLLWHLTTLKAIYCFIYYLTVTTVP